MLLFYAYLHKYVDSCLSQVYLAESERNNTTGVRAHSLALRQQSSILANTPRGLCQAVSLCLHAHTHTQIYIYVCVCVCVCTRVRTCVCVCACMCVCKETERDSQSESPRGVLAKILDCSLKASERARTRKVGRVSIPASSVLRV